MAKSGAAVRWSVQCKERGRPAKAQPGADLCAECLAVLRSSEAAVGPPAKAAAQATPGPEVIMQAVGHNGQLELLPGRIRIRRAGVLAFIGHGLKGDKEILVSHISSIQYKRAGEFINGYIQFAFVGGQETKRGIFDATQDENSIVFRLSQQPAFDAIKAEIERAMTAPQAGPAPASALDELAKLASLRDRGILSEEEFAEQKRRLLS